MQKNIKTGLVGIFVFAGFSIISLATQQDDMVWYRTNYAVRRAVLGKFTADQMYRDELRRKSVEAFKNNPHRKEFLKKHPGFLKANPELR